MRSVVILANLKHTSSLIFDRKRTKFGRVQNRQRLGRLLLAIAAVKNATVPTHFDHAWDTAKIHYWGNAWEGRKMMTYDGYEDGSKELRRLDSGYADHVYEYQSNLKKNEGPRLQLDVGFPPNKANAPGSAEDDEFVESGLDLPPLNSFEDVYFAHTRNTAEKNSPNDTLVGWTEERAYEPQSVDAQKPIEDPVRKGNCRIADDDSSNPDEVTKGPGNNFEKTKQRYDAAVKKYDEAMQKYNDAKREHDELLRELEENRRAAIEARRQSKNEVSNRVLRKVLGPAGLLLPTIELF